MENDSCFAFGHGHLRACRTGEVGASSEALTLYLDRVEQIADNGASQPTPSRAFASISLPYFILGLECSNSDTSQTKAVVLPLNPPKDV